MEQQPLPHRNIESGPNEWPHAACKRNRAYEMDTPFLNHDDQQPHKIALMDLRDWHEHGTRLESLRRVAELQDRRIKELLADIAARDRHAADIMGRLEMYRAKDKDRKRAELEGELGIVDLPTQTFNSKEP